MPGHEKPREVHNSVVVCGGKREAPHPPRRLDLPVGIPVTCPDCGLTYRRAPHLSGYNHASWPKQS